MGTFSRHSSNEAEAPARGSAHAGEAKQRVFEGSYASPWAIAASLTAALLIGAISIYVRYFHDADALWLEVFFLVLAVLAGSGAALFGSYKVELQSSRLSISSLLHYRDIYYREIRSIYLDKSKVSEKKTEPVLTLELKNGDKIPFRGLRKGRAAGMCERLEEMGVRVEPPEEWARS
jgi:hypothetical protein